MALVSTVYPFKWKGATFCSLTEIRIDQPQHPLFGSRLEAVTAPIRTAKYNSTGRAPAADRPCFCCQASMYVTTGFRMGTVTRTSTEHRMACMALPCLDGVRHKGHQIGTKGISIMQHRGVTCLPSQVVRRSPPRQNVYENGAKWPPRAVLPMYVLVVYLSSNPRKPDAKHRCL